MKEELELQLIEKNPEVFLFHNFRGRGHFVFECDDGWYNILNAMFNNITSNIRYNNKRLNELMEAQDMIDNGCRDQVPDYLQQRISSLNNGNGEWPVEMEFPVVQQIKEKFGTLNVYVRKYDDRTQDLIGFAESMSATTCERCGNIGELRKGSWIKTLCDEHEKERQALLAERAAEQASYEKNYMDNE